MRKPNKTRGEVALRLCGVDLILCAEIARLEMLETLTDGLNLVALVHSLNGRKISVVKAGLEALTIEGDWEKAWAKMVGAAEIPGIADSLINALVPDGEDDAGKNAEAGAESG